MRVHQRGRLDALRPIVVLGGLVALMAPAFAGRSADPFPERRLANREQAAGLLAGASPRLPQLTSRLRLLRGSHVDRGESVHRAIVLLERRPILPSEHLWQTTEGTTIRYTTTDGAVDRVAPLDEDQDGVPDVVEASARGIDEARSLLVERLQFPAPERFEVVHADLGGRIGGYLTTDERSGAGSTMVLEAAPDEGPLAARRAAIEQYAHAVVLTLSPQFPPVWAEALAHWTLLAVDGHPQRSESFVLSERLARMGAGLVTEDLELGAGNALWLAFLDQAFGPVALRLTIEELARGGAETTALDRALRRSSDVDLASAFREFQLWSILVGPRSDRFHFSFAADLAPAVCASSNLGLPALSVQADPAIAPWGWALARILPAENDGGLGVRFEGEFPVRWEVDLLLVAEDGTLRRLPLELTDGRGEVSVPLDDVAEALLLVRNLGGDDSSPRRYTYAAHRESGYPFELASLDVVEHDEGVAIAWETASERELVGFNIVRVREAGGEEATVNPLWVPALGDVNTPTSYFFVDQTADPTISYFYRVEGVTRRGLTSRSEQVAVRRPPPARRASALRVLPR